MIVLYQLLLELGVMVIDHTHLKMMELIHLTQEKVVEVELILLLVTNK